MQPWIKVALLALVLGAAVTVALLFPRYRDELLGGTVVPLLVWLGTSIGRRWGWLEGALEERKKITEEHNTIKQREPTERVDTIRDEDGRVDVGAVLITGTVIALLATGFAFGYWAGALSVLR